MSPPKENGFKEFTNVFRHRLPEAASRLTNHGSRCNRKHAQSSLGLLFRNSEHASTAKPEGVLELGRVGVRTRVLPETLRRKNRTREIKTPVPAYQRKTKIYNTLGTTGQTYSRDVRPRLPGSSEQSIFRAIQPPSEPGLSARPPRRYTSHTASLASGHRSRRRATTGRSRPAHAASRNTRRGSRSNTRRRR